ncbi:uncharacterized protein EV422DRAFT_89409 [Fimicolochytrium jonesii]|uniref:uncharacterized protein n=1 Tax=Fimicolochytrium jonesii TaxID=1396493 RepID=UPI0022FED9CC|nr:uncharacterized protein EV422DRAFT_89409 [Fimicolochytrium jonesii]KAI8819873.1 hypothetical protein EV422DRAFT_89409 [Fimicolochytrium jonesii]
MSPLEMGSAMKHFVTCNPSRMPKRLRHLKNTPCSVREAVMQELAKAYEYHQGIDHISSVMDSDYHSPAETRALRRRRFLIHERIQNRVRECHLRVAGWLTRNFQFVHTSPFETEEMMRRVGENGRKRRIGRKTARELLMWRHAPFRRALQMRQEELRGTLVEIAGEEYSQVAKSCLSWRLSQCRRRVSPPCGGTVINFN